MGGGSKVRRQQGQRGRRRISATARCRRKVAIEAVSRLDPREEPGTDLTPEAAWPPDGAACVARPRLVTWTLDGIVAECPDRLRGHVGNAVGCGTPALTEPDVLFVNKGWTRHS